MDSHGPMGRLGRSMEAMEQQAVEAMQLLAEVGCPLGGSETLHEAVRHGRLRLARFLHDCGVCTVDPGAVVAAVQGGCGVGAGCGWQGGGVVLVSIRV